MTSILLLTILLVDGVFVLTVSLVWHQGILNLELGVGDAAAIVLLIVKLTLTVEGAELGVVLDEVVLAILHLRLVV